MPLSFTIYGPDKTRRATCDTIDGAALLCRLYGDGSRIRYAGRVVWKQGFDEIRYDVSSSTDYLNAVAHLVWQRIDSNRKESYDKVNGPGAATELLKAISERNQS